MIDQQNEKSNRIKELKKPITVWEAADRIEELVKERDGLLRVVTDNHVALQRAEVAEAKLAKAVEALREILMKPRDADKFYVELWADTIKEIRAVLAKLEAKE